FEGEAAIPLPRPPRRETTSLLSRARDICVRLRDQEPVGVQPRLQAGYGTPECLSFPRLCARPAHAVSWYLSIAARALPHRKRRPGPGSDVLGPSCNHRVRNAT